VKQYFLKGYTATGYMGGRNTMYGYAVEFIEGVLEIWNFA